MIERGQLYTAPWMPGLKYDMPGPVVRLIQQIASISQRLGYVPAMELIQEVQWSARNDIDGRPLEFDLVEYYVRVAMVLGIIGGLVAPTGEQVTLEVDASVIGEQADA